MCAAFPDKADNYRHGRKQNRETGEPQPFDGD